MQTNSISRNMKGKGNEYLSTHWYLESSIPSSWGDADELGKINCLGKVENVHMRWMLDSKKSVWAWCGPPVSPPIS